jgi:glycosyltransferase involved in cell wall biosynthesis|tara:strand:- start:2231 stop:3613 length:1383 start_codon:yes stop_codon:yes gene_type:complete
MAKKKILLLSDDLRLSSGVGTMSKEIVFGTLHEYDWFQVGAAIDHPEAGKLVDLSEQVKKDIRPDVKDPYLKILPCSGYGNQDMIRELMKHEQPDAIMIYTDPRFWDWLFHMEHEVRQQIPIFYYNIWDDLPYPMWNEPFYESVDLLMNISKQTNNIVKNVRKEIPVEDWQCTYVPHGIDESKYYPIGEEHEEFADMNAWFDNQLHSMNPEYVIFYNNRNIRRKQPADIILAFRAFCDTLTKEEASKCMLLMHTQPTDPNGTNLPEVATQLCGGYNVAFSSKKLDTKYLNYMYNKASVTINIASNEGFGLGTAESLMAGTPILVNVTGGLQDQCGFRKEDGSYLTEDDYVTEWGSNHDGKYTECGEWAFPVFPSNRSIQGSIPTPYIFDDRASFEDVALKMKEIYDIKSELKDRGEKGREFVLSEEIGMTAKNMCNRFINDMETAWKEFKPRKKFSIYKV